MLPVVAALLVITSLDCSSLQRSVLTAVVTSFRWASAAQEWDWEVAYGSREEAEECDCASHGLAHQAVYLALHPGQGSSAYKGSRSRDPAERNEYSTV